MTKPLDFSEEVKFAGKAGYLSRGIWEEFFAHGKVNWRNRQWRMMREKGLFKQYQSGVAPTFYILNPKSYAVRRILGDRIGRPPPVSNLGHDEFLVRGLMKLQRSGDIRHFTLERELKKDFHPGMSSNDKFPDALIRTRAGQLFAIELELGRKSIKRYRDILLRYCFQEDLDGVIYVCGLDVFDALEQAKKSVNALNLNLLRASLEDWGSCDRKVNMLFSHTISTVPSR